ncbi:unnamed protein product [Arctia plantaginis]|uniref:Nuclease HARBI1 n=1 Tax=Arctia plantaginis TaxID=874455 RepID=A0A8S1AWI0_ARCPL|nr:unnamed protein product [Arctia plantaginis]
MTERKVQSNHFSPILIGVYYTVNNIVILESRYYHKTANTEVGYYTYQYYHFSSALYLLESGCVSEIMDNRRKSVLAVVLAFALKRKRCRKRWVKNWVLKRNQYTHLNITQEMLLGDDLNDYAIYFRMSEDLFEKLLNLASPYITKQDTHMRQAISPREKLAVTLRYIATGRSFRCLKTSCIISEAVISKAVISTCRAMMYVLRDYIKMPTNTEDWIDIANEFGSLYNFPIHKESKYIRSTDNDEDTLGNIEACLNRNASSDAKAVRDQFRQYFIDTARLQNVRNAERQANGRMLVSKLI